MPAAVTVTVRLPELVAPDAAVTVAVSTWAVPAVNASDADVVFVATTRTRLLPETILALRA